MAMFRARVTRTVRINAPAFTRAQRLKIGQRALDKVRSRIQRAVDADDAPAKPLTAHSAIVKQRRKHKRPIRDWTESGDMLRDLAVTVASSKKIIIAPRSDEQRRKLAYNQQICEMFALSPSDEDAINSDFEDEAILNARRMAVPQRSGEFL